MFGAFTQTSTPLTLGFAVLQYAMFTLEFRLSVQKGDKGSDRWSILLQINSLSLSRDQLNPAYRDILYTLKAHFQPILPSRALCRKPVPHWCPNTTKLEMKKL